MSIFVIRSFSWLKGLFELSASFVWPFPFWIKKCLNWNCGWRCHIHFYFAILRLYSPSMCFKNLDKLNLILFETGANFCYCPKNITNFKSGPKWPKNKHLASPPRLSLNLWYTKNHLKFSQQVFLIGQFH